MLGVQSWWRHLVTLISQTFRVWWAVLPKVVIAWTTGWLIYQLSIAVTAPVQETYPWPAVIIFSFGLVCQLAAIIVGIRIAGEPAGLWDKLPPAAAQIGREESLVKVVSVSLLPFVGVYAAFGGIQSATYSLFISGALESTVILNPQAATTILDPRTAQQRLVIGAVLVGCYLLRRGLEATADRTGRWFFGLLGALVEGFFSVVLIFGGSRMLGDLGEWLQERVLYGWLLALGDTFMGWLASFHIVIPQILRVGWEFLATDLWPLLSEAMLQPLLWLAVAGLVYGTYTLSVADLWQKADERDVLSNALIKRNKRLHALQQRSVHASQGSRRVAMEFFEVFVGDLEDRIIPFIQSLRHVLRVGLPFVGAYALLYSVINFLETSSFMVARQIMGGQYFHFWFRVDEGLDLIGGLLSQPLRVSLLAVAMTLTLSVNKKVDAEEAALASDAPGGAIRAPQPRRRMVLYWVPTLAITLASLLAAGGVIRASEAMPSTHQTKVPPGESADIMPGQPMRVVDLGAGQQLEVNDEQPLALRTEALFVGVTIEITSHKREAHSIECTMYSPRADGEWTRTQAAQSRLKTTGQLGYTMRGMYVFERPADGLVGAQLRCQLFAFYISYEPELIFDLGIDEAKQAELAEQTGVLTVPADVEEVAK